MIGASDMRFCGSLTYLAIENSNCPNLYTYEMFERNNLADLPYPIEPQDVNLYEDLLQINIYIYTFSDDEGKGRHPLFTSRK